MLMKPYRYLITVGAAIFVFTCGIGATIGARQNHAAQHERAVQHIPAGCAR